MSLQLNTVQVPTKWFSVYQQMSLCNIPRVARFLASLWEKHENSIDACNETALVANNVLRRLGKAYRQIAPFYICEEHMQNVNLHVIRNLTLCSFLTQHWPREISASEILPCF
ncbi:hypothetical protein AcV7_010011 [Taiwanofungus camphoratus]|nr:hypothetical protein AcV7_010011 [Antrodia cinnamomea]